MSDFNPYAAPTADVGERPAISPTGEGLWQSGRVLVMEKTAVLPDVCVVCNAPADGFSLRRRLAWHSPWWYFTIFLGVLIYIIVALIVQRRADIRVGLCMTHRQRRRTWLTVAWMIVALAVALPFVLGWLDPDAIAFGFLALPLLLLAAALVGLYGARVVYPKRIDAEYAMLGGVSPAFLMTLPEWQGTRP